MKLFLFSSVKVYSSSIRGNPFAFLDLLLGCVSFICGAGPPYENRRFTEDVIVDTSSFFWLN